MFFIFENNKLHYYIYSFTTAWVILQLSPTRHIELRFDLPECTQTDDRKIETVGK